MLNFNAVLNAVLKAALKLRNLFYYVPRNINENTWNLIMDSMVTTFYLLLSQLEEKNINFK